MCTSSGSDIRTLQYLINLAYITTKIIIGIRTPAAPGHLSNTEPSPISIIWCFSKAGTWLSTCQQFGAILPVLAPHLPPCFLALV
jgi:hypothetical protein